MASNRRYPERQCINPDCGALFIPHDKRQMHCTRQCQQNKNNDIKNEKAEKERYGTRLKESDNALEILYVYDGGESRTFSRPLLLHSKVDLSIGKTQYIKADNRVIRWYVFYGLERCKYRGEEEYWIVPNKDYFS